MNTQPAGSTPSLSGEQKAFPPVSEEIPVIEVTEMGMEEVMLLWDGQSEAFNTELRNRPETNCYGYWQKKMAEKQRELEER